MELHNDPVLPGEVQIRQTTATNSRIVRVCRQMYREALPVFYKMVELQLWDIGSPGWIQLPKDSRIGCFRIVTLMYPAVSYLRFYHLTNLKKTRHLKFKTTWHFWEPQELGMDMSTVVTEDSARYYAGAESIINTYRVNDWMKTLEMALVEMQRRNKTRRIAGNDLSASLVWSDFDFVTRGDEIHPLPGSPTFVLTLWDDKEVTFRYTFDGESYQANQKHQLDRMSQARAHAISLHLGTTRWPRCLRILNDFTMSKVRRGIIRS